MRKLIIVTLMLLASPAVASTPSAAAGMQRASARACRAASDLDAAKIVGRVGFSDDFGVEALLVGGTWRPRHMRGARATMLCLYDRRTRRAEVQEAKGWTAPR